MAENKHYTQIPEIKHPRTKLEEVIPLPAPFTVYIDPCGACNFKCGFCPCNNSDYNAKERHKRMTWDIFERTLEGLKNWRDAGTPVKVVNLYAFGEPLLNPNTADMLKAVKDSNVCREVRLTTNASLLTPELGQKLIDAGLDHLRVSVESLDSQGYRDVCGVNTTFEEIVGNVKEYYTASRGTGCMVDVKIISSALQNAEDERKFYETFGPISDTHFVEEIGEIWPEFDRMKMPENIGAEGRKTCYKKANSTQKICTFPFTDMVVHSNGDVSPCCVDWKGSVIYGNVSEMTLNEMWNSNIHRAFQISHLNRSAYEETMCRNCKRLPLDDIDRYAEQILSRIKNI